MALFLDITTSAEFWRKIYPVNQAPVRTLPIASEACSFSARDAKRLAPSWATPEFLEPIGGKISLLVFDKKQRRNSSLHVTHLWGSRIPEGSFHALSDTVYVMSPGFMFLMAATLLSEQKLVAFGYELCGHYSFDDTSKRGIRKRSVPLTTIDALRNYLKGTENCRGHRRATSALRHVLEHSASPMETFDAMALFGTPRLGGYRLGTPVMNHEVPLNAHAARIAKRSKCYLDMGFPAHKLDIEHHGVDHASPEAWASDRARVNALQKMGFTVIELTFEQINDLRAFEFIAIHIAKILGKRLRKHTLGATPERLALRKEVFDWNHSGGRLRER